MNADLQAARLERALRAALADLQSATLGRDLADLTVDKQKQAFYQKQINEILRRMKSKNALDALATPLTDTYMAGFSRQVFTQIPDYAVEWEREPASKDKGKALANFSINTDALRALTNAVVNPLQVPFIAPNLDPMGVEKMLEIATKGFAKGSSWAELSKDISKALPGAAKLVKDQLKKGYQVEFPSGYRMPAEKYAKVLARTTTVWAGNKGALDRAEDAGSPCMFVAISPGTCDFCVALEGKVYAITAEASDKYDVPLLSACPNGGPPFHVNCRHSLAPFTPRKADEGKLPKAPESLLTRAEGKGAANSAQKAFEEILKKDPLPYAKQYAETAARRGFGDETTPTPADLAGKPIPDPDEGNAKTFPEAGKKALAEDVNLAQSGSVMKRDDFRQEIAKSLRNATETGFDKDGQLHYYDAKNQRLVAVDPSTGNVTSTQQMKPAEWIEKKQDLTMDSAKTPPTSPPPLPAPTPVPVAPPAQPALKPAGTPVSTSLTNKTKPGQSKTIDEAVKAIDAIHGDGSLKPIPVKTGTKNTMGDDLGQYRATFTSAVDINVRNTETGEDAKVTFTHEAGHWLDHIGIPSKTKFASEEATSPLKDVMDAIRKSQSFQDIDTAFASAPVSKAKIQAYVDYLKLPQEMFARAYTQFIAEESGDAAMLAVLMSKNNIKEHWSAGEFAVIKDEMLKAFAALGWIK